MAQEPPQGPTAASTTLDAISLRVQIDLSEIGNRLQNETARLVADYAQRGLTGDALGAAVERELLALFDDTSAARSGREATHEAFALGRNLEAQRQADRIGSVVRTEILDENTCDPCRAEDGVVVTLNTPPYFEHMPPNGCEGREQCRGIYIYRGRA